jgi:hypothetical protein
MACERRARRAIKPAVAEDGNRAFTILGETARIYRHCALSRLPDAGGAAGP